MKDRCTILMTILWAGLCFSSNLTANSDFYAYYTKVQHSATDYLGKYPDIIVVLGAGRQLEFTRQTGYQPLWRTASGTHLIDDMFPGRDKDSDFYYTYVRLMANEPDKIVVHWRYYKDTKILEEANRALNSLSPHGFLGVIHELFTIYPDGRVERQLMEAKGTRIGDWRHPEMETTQTLRLRDDGIEHGPVSWGRPGPIYPRAAVDGNPVKAEPKLPDPIRMWTFDEGLEPSEDLIFEEKAEGEWRIEGLMSVFKKGVSGTALAFDGYYSALTPEWEDREVAEPENAMTITAWVALDVYPYNNAPIIHNSSGFGEEGWYFGVDPYGHLLFTIGGKTIKSQAVLPLYNWTHAAVAIGKGRSYMYIDGKEVASGRYSGKIQAPDTDIVIGLNNEMERCTDYVRTPDQNLPFIYGIQGLLDEVRMYDRQLSSDQITKSFETFMPMERTSDLAKAVLPGEVGQADLFGAHYKTLQFHELWDNMWRVPEGADIVVKFDRNPCSVVYWRGSNYAASWVTDNNRWMADQSSEIFTKHGCSEHMADKQTRHSYARIIENTPARVVVHWRYPCVDVSYYCANRRNWSDEYHTIYPDGTAIRKVNWNKVYDQPGFQDIQFFTNPGETALDVVDLQAVTLANLDGEVFEMHWAKPNRIPENELEDASIQYLNSKSEYHVFAVYQGGELGAWGTNEQSRYTDDPFAGPWNHWPIYFVPSDGRFAVAHDRVTHFALGANDAAPEFGSVVMYGFTNEDITTLVPAAKSWQDPATLVNVSGAKSHGYDKDQKAFVLTAQGSKTTFTVDASAKSPMVNPCFVVKNWGSDSEAHLKVNGSRQKASAAFRQGVVRDTDGTQTLVIWLEIIADQKTSIEIARK
jgi:hypothetical protein